MSLWKACDVSYPKLSTFHQGGITSSLKLPLHGHIEDNVEFGWGRVKEGSVVYILSKSFCLVNVLLVSLYLYTCLLVCEADSLFFKPLC